MIHRYGPNRVATFYIGLRRGKKLKNRTGACANMPSLIPIEIVDETLLSLRKQQVGTHIGATRVSAEGWYESEQEPSVVYTIVHIPNEHEPTPREFVRNMEILSERLAKALCQDEILLVYDDSHKRVAYGVESEPPFVSKIKMKPRRKHLRYRKPTTHRHLATG